MSLIVLLKVVTRLVAPAMDYYWLFMNDIIFTFWQLKGMFWQKRILANIQLVSWLELKSLLRAS